VLIRYRLCGKWGETELLIDQGLEPSPRLLALAVMADDFLPEYFQPDR
jgi:hypothetical protein